MPTKPLVTTLPKGRLRQCPGDQPLVILGEADHADLGFHNMEIISQHNSDYKSLYKHIDLI